LTKGRRTEVEVSEPNYRVRSKEVEVELYRAVEVQKMSKI